MNRDRYDPITGQYYDDPKYDKGGRTIGDHYERQTTQIDLDKKIVCDYKHKPDKYEKIPTAYGEDDTSGDSNDRSRCCASRTVVLELDDEEDDDDEDDDDDDEEVCEFLELETLP
jgi:hypothetical protein